MFLDVWNPPSIICFGSENLLKAFFMPLSVHGKSPCFLRCCFSALVSVDCAVLIFASVDVREFLE